MINKAYKNVMKENIEVAEKHIRAQPVEYRFSSYNDPKGKTDMNSSSHTRQNSNVNAKN